MPDYYVFQPQSDPVSDNLYALLHHPGGDSLTPITADDAAAAAEYAASEWSVEVGESLLVIGVEGVERFSTVLVGPTGATVERRSGPS